MKKLNQMIVSIGIMILLACPAMAGDAPAELIENTVNHLFGEFTERRSELEGNKSDLFELVDRVASPAFDFGYISKLVLGKNWKSASDQQRSDFAVEFKRLLIVTYATALFKYTGNEKMELGETEIKEKKGKKFGTVKSEVTISEGKPIPVSYSLVQDAEGVWKIYNLIVGDLNMVLNYRSVVDSTIQSEGVDGLISSMRENNDKNYH